MPGSRAGTALGQLVHGNVQRLGDALHHPALWYGDAVLVAGDRPARHAAQLAQPALGEAPLLSDCPDILADGHGRSPFPQPPTRMAMWARVALSFLNSSSRRLDCRTLLWRSARLTWTSTWVRRARLTSFPQAQTAAKR